MNPGQDDSFIIALTTTQCYGNDVPNLQGFRNVAKSIATDEIKAIYEAEWEERRKEEEEEKRKQEKARSEAEAKRKKDAADSAKRQQEEVRQKRVLRISYLDWSGRCQRLLGGSAPITTFPYLPTDVCTCDDPICGPRKIEKKLLACQHDVEKLLRASGQYSLEFLSKERLPWHPDKFGRKCSDAPNKVELLMQTTEMFSMFQVLIAAETSES
jgi:hypothetical protein